MSRTKWYKTKCHTDKMSRDKLSTIPKIPQLQHKNQMKIEKMLWKKLLIDDYCLLSFCCLFSSLGSHFKTLIKLHSLFIFLKKCLCVLLILYLADLTAWYKYVRRYFIEHTCPELLKYRDDCEIIKLGSTEIKVPPVISLSQIYRKTSFSQFSILNGQKNKLFEFKLILKFFVPDAHDASLLWDNLYSIKFCKGSLDEMVVCKNWGCYLCWHSVTPASFPCLSDIRLIISKESVG